MSSIFNLDAPIWEFMGEIADVVVLSLLWWICSLGIITIGASTTAMYYVLGKKVRQETTYVVKDFFKSFKQNFRQSVPLTLMTIIGYISLFIYLILVFQNLVTDVQLVPNYVLIPITILFAFEFLNLNAYMWSLLARFELKSVGIIKNSFMMIHRHLLTTLVNIIIIVAIVFLITQCGLFIIIAPGLIFGGQSYLLQRVYTSYIEAGAKEATASQMA